MSLKNLSVTTKIPKLLESKLIDKRISKIYLKFEKSLNLNENFIVAVSGGADSLSLAFLAKIYSIKKKLTSKFFIIDHKLRTDSTNEAKSVKKILKKYYINAEILTWKGRKPSRNIQSLARKKRYELLYNQCDKLKINNILLGHHQDDLFENFFIRISRGSGLKGLVSLDKENKINNKNLLRPLLDYKKEDLVFLSKRVFGYYVEDPSNMDEKFQRVKIRKLIKEFQNIGLEKKNFIHTIKNLKHSNTVVEFYVNKNLQKNAFFSPKKKELILNQKFFQQPYEVIFRGLSNLIQFIGNRYYSVRGKKLDRIIDNVQNKGSFKVTLGGCIIERVNQSIIISKEH